MTRALFLFNHDAAHQVAHLAGVAGAMAARHAGVEVIVACATPAIEQAVRAHIPHAMTANIRWELLTLPRWLDQLAAPVNRLLPAQRLLRLRHFAPLLQSADIVISTERTCLRAKAHMQGPVPLFAIIPHGAGDRNVSYHADFTRFDLVLVAGEKIRSAMAGIGVPPARLRIIGYPKFDGIMLARRPSPFANAKPTFVYNPHFDPHLSSWYDAGPDLLRWFASPAGQGFNCIFAPHVMLFRKATHISPEYRTFRRRPPIPAEALAAPNILIDTASERLFDMTHMLSADGYIGDMSSQIYEFLTLPRAAFFLDCHHGQRDEPEAQHLHWRAGPVVESVGALTALLPQWQQCAADYAPAQAALFDWTFDRSETPSVARAADAIAAAISG